MEYWRWRVVHLWVEGFMEVFATAAIAFLFTQFGLLRPDSAARATLLSTSIFLISGIPGTLHPLYFSGTPVSAMAIGASFSAIEVVLLVLVGMEAYGTWQMQHRAGWMQAYAWPIKSFVAVAFWSFVGAGLFGFLINPPLAHYDMQGLNTTPVHAHAALFGVYGLLSLGLAQAWASVEHGLWYARSADFPQQPVLEALRWMRLVGDTLFIAGVLAFVGFVAGLWTRRPAGAASARSAPAGEAATMAAPAASRTPAA
ncbi:uncharacterized protein SOCEGT47_019250 [Sorangium cellulosum]|uniref:Uncharacterized protein n=1 Tax=Sorangium cellulosum TaxID=56 RepID=A0A3S7UWB7_SORCE|nr:cbb3-type cytochrome c oxidase subunit I [Sorangium cellulosum]AUX21441.1 uncharacterized protein SOCEGT47_019250 [Sorangium cellulosum]AYM53054.1 hypothetical protein [Sorangium cellulosum]